MNDIEDDNKTSEDETSKDVDEDEEDYYTITIRLPSIIESILSIPSVLEDLKEDIDFIKEKIPSILELEEPARAEEVSLLQERFEKMESRYEKVHEAADKVLTLSEDELGVFTAFTILNNRINDTNNRIDDINKWLRILVPLLFVATVIAALLDKIVAILG